jgi:ApbE superfamily uncharacterized protein (UPF0280 family)
MGNPRWKSYRVCHLETDLWIAVSAESYNSAAENYSMDRILFYRNILDNHIQEFPDFLTSLTPIPKRSDTNPLFHDMYRASEKAGTGPMSAVAGAVAEYICKDLQTKFRFPEVVVENGGDIFINLTHPATISVHAGSSPLSEKIGLLIKPEQTPISVCCSSGTEGHSLSFGTADACVVACHSGALADAFATAGCNEVKNPDMVISVTEQMLQSPEIISVVIIKDDRVGIGGKIEITVLDDKIVSDLS